MSMSKKVTPASSLSLNVKSIRMLTADDLRKVTGGGIFVPTTGSACKKKRKGK